MAAPAKKPRPGAAARGRHPARIGIGGWVYAPWRATFYPAGMRPAEWLPYASGKLTSIEINGTFYRTQSEATFRAWHDATPEGFVFAVKGPRAATQSRDPERTAASVARFLGSGLTALGPKLGPILWQFPPTRRFDPEELSSFLDLLPPAQEGCGLRHAVEAQHPSFAAEDCAALLRGRNVARVLVHAGAEVEHDPTADFVYARLKGSVAEEPAGYTAEALDCWAARIGRWAEQRDCYAYVIAGAKERNPAAAMGLIERLRDAR